MRLGVTLFLVLCLLAMMASVKGHSDGSIVRILPFLGGHPPGLYDYAGLGIIFFTLHRISGMSRSAADDEPEYEEDEDELEDDEDGEEGD